MLKNNNRRVIGHMAKCARKGSGPRSLVLLAAIALSSFLLFTILNVGITYFRMWRLQQLRLNGAEYDAILYGCSGEQMDKLTANPDIAEIAVMGLAGWLDEAGSQAVTDTRLVWVDDVYWEIFSAPARTYLLGRYPTEADEVLVSKEALERAGLSGCGVGDTFAAEWTGSGGVQRQTRFRISGIWDGYGPTGAFFVSEAFYEQCGFELSDISSGRILLELKRKLVTKRWQSELIESLDLGRRQNLFFMAETGFSVPIYLGLAGLIVVVCLLAYLLIYNIMSLSVAANIRYYGLLSTIGMTGRQIRAFLYRQMLVLGAQGILSGILAGVVVAFLVLPSLVGAFGISEKVVVEFRPEVFLLTLALASVTIYVGSRKPAKMASLISPIEASRYLGIRSAKRSGVRAGKNCRRGHGARVTERWSVLWRMGGRKVVRNPKKTAIIMLSLSAGLSVFLCVTTLIQSQGPRTIVSNAWGDDMEIMNATLRKEDRTKWKKLLDDSLAAEIAEIPGVRGVRVIKAKEITVPWESGFADRWMREFYHTWMDIPYESDLEEYKAHPENYGTFLVGIEDADLPLLQDSLEQPLNEADFLAGKTCVLYLNDLPFQTDDLRGETVRCAEYGGDGTFAFEIGGLMMSPAFVGPMMGFAPTVIVSGSAMDALNLTGDIYKIRVSYDSEYDAQTEDAVFELLESRTELRLLKVESKIQELEAMRDAQGNMSEVGIGLSLILALIGVMNYVNTVTGNIESRRRELAILEGIGMTQRQMKRMLIREGAIYALGAFLLTLLIGLPATYGLYEAVNYNRVPFLVPVVPIAVVLAAVFLICIGVPILILHVIGHKGSVIEAIKMPDSL